MENNHKEKKKRLEEEEIYRQQDPNQTSQQIFSKLPMDVTFDIFSRLPLKAITQCRWVCKSWYNLILHPRFAEVHYARAIQNTSHCLFLREMYHDHFYLIDYEAFDNLETSTTAHHIKFKEFPTVRRNQFFILGSVNGLICFYCRSEPYYIVNPITRDYVILPKPPPKTFLSVVSGFGFDSVTGDYKVILIFNKSLRVEAHAEAEVCTLRSGSWRAIKKVPSITIMRESNVFVNGYLHWVSCENGSRVIVSFNVGTEEFSEIQLPPYLNKDEIKTFVSLGVLRECVCLIITDESSRNQEIWVMKEYGVEGSWTKEFVFRNKYGGFWNEFPDIIQLRNGELLWLDNYQRLGYYHSLKKLFKPIAIENFNEESMVLRPPILQVGSLFSPKYVGNH